MMYIGAGDVLLCAVEKSHFVCLAVRQLSQLMRRSVACQDGKRRSANHAACKWYEELKMPASGCVAMV